MPTRDHGRDSRRSSKSSAGSKDVNKNNSERTSKAKSTQVYDARRRASQQVENGLKISTERPVLKSRTNSAPLVQTINEPGSREALEHAEKSEKGIADSADATFVVGLTEIDQDEDEVAGVVGAVRHFETFPSSKTSGALPDINIAVIGAERVGKSTFVRNALDLPFPSDSHAVERKIEVDGSDYLLRLLEISIDDIEVDEDDAVSFPGTIEDKIMPHIDGALTLYDVKDQTSLENIPEMLSAINKAGIPSLLVSCKCDAPPEERDVNPRVVEETAKRNVKDLDTLRVSAHAPESPRQGISKILRAIVSGIPDNGVAKYERIRSLSPSRRRAQSNAVPSLSPRRRQDHGHSRATSEYTGSLYKDQLQSRHNSSLTAHNSSDRLKTHSENSREDMYGSFLIEESPSEASDESFHSSDETVVRSVGDLKPSTTSSEDGVTFDELVDRLLTQPTSKADQKFVAIFLALYRKFAAPGRLLEAIVQRFDDMERRGEACMIKTISQLRYLSILEQWIGTYPGDFAYLRTRRRMRTFIGKLSQSRIFSAAAKMMNAHLDVAREDDDTDWACCDKDRKSRTCEYPVSLSTASILIDDPNFLEGFLISSPSADDDDDVTVTAGGDMSESMSSSGLLSQHSANVGNAQKQATLLLPIPRQAITKIQWRALMEYPDEVIARELTRIDWIMFSSIRPRDLVRQVSLTEEQKAGCMNLAYVNRMIDHFNQIAFWVENFVLLRDKPKHRALMLEKFMRIARKLRELNNYNALGAVIAGVKSTAVHRLAATRDLIPPTVGRDWMKLEILMGQSSSYKAYRLAWENSSSERIPYLPLHRRDLVSAEEGNKTFVGDERDGRINWRKFEIMGDVIVSMQKAQSVPYKGLVGARGNEQLKELVLDMKLIKDEDELFARSKQVEPSGTPALGTTAKFKELFKR